DARLRSSSISFKWSAIKMAKKVIGEIKLQIPAGQANPSPPLGPALGQRGDAGAAGDDYTCDCHGLCGPLVHSHHENAADVGAAQESGRLGERLRRARQGESRPRDAGPDPPDRRGEAARSYREGSRCGGKDGRRNRTQSRSRNRRIIEDRIMKRHGKGYNNALAKVDRGTRYQLEEGLKLVQETKRAKFDETVELAVRLGVDPKQADQNIRGTVALPH